MPDIIQLLPDNVANQIAAGEVVQRPASVVKELMENAVDAGAGHIKLIIKDAGRTLIQVVDDGKGMSPTDARLAFERHTTSKIRTAKDLFNLHTNGFRGEALASIAAIAHVIMKTRFIEDELGTQIQINGGKVISQEVISKPAGTSIEVRNLFYNIPVRRNFLKSNTVETRHIIDAFQRVALTYPEINFSMIHNDSEIFNLPAGNLKKRIVNIFGKKIDEKLIPIAEDTEILTVEGFVAKPEFAKKKRGEQFFFVNGRFIKNAYLHHAVLSAFEELLPNGYHPSYFLYLSVPPASIDINIHPTKTEIKFDNDRDLYAIIRSTVKHSLGQFSVGPVLDFDKNPDLDTPYSYKDKEIDTPKVSVDPSFNPFESEVGNIPVYRQKDSDKNWKALYTNTNDLAGREFTNNNDEKTNFELFEEERNSQTTYQVHQKYIVSTIKSGVVFIDQQAAHQRILYEDYLEKITVTGIGSQQLLFPKILSFNKDDILLLKELQPDLESCGIVFDISEKEAISITAKPLSITDTQLQPLFENILENFKNNIPETSFSQLDSIAKSMSKSSAIKKGIKLSIKEQEDIVNKLFLCKEPNFSPFGKKTYITISLEELDNKFNQ